MSSTSVCFVSDSLVAICWNRAVLLTSLLYCVIADVVLGVCVPFLFYVLGGLSNSSVSVSDHNLFINFKKYLFL